MAESIAAGAFRPPAAQVAQGAQAQGPGFDQLAAFCRVAATLAPTNDSDIKVEVWLPISGWNGKFMAVGNSGFNGVIPYGAMRPMLARGYAVAATDTGHQSGVGDASWALGHPEKQIDFGYRAVHEMTVKAKAIIEAYYAAAPKYSYWSGCSSGGKQGLKEAQRFPDDYDGIIAGAPANYWTHLMTQIMWVAHAVRIDPASSIQQSKYAAINDAVMAQCDDRDGVKDGVLENPRACRFNPSVLKCQSTDAQTCLTEPQLAALRKVYSPAVHPRTGKEIFPGLSVGSELGWGQLPQPFAIAETYYKYVVFGDPAWDYRTLDFDTHLAKAVATDTAIGQFTANDPDLSAFKKRGGKLIQYHGWNDQQISPLNSINYYERVIASMGSRRKTEDFYRLFMAPGMNHCRGGTGPDSFDMIDAIEQWVERGIAPSRIIASRNVDAQIVRTRPLCPYPQVAVYAGKGSTDDASSFMCKSR